MKFKEGQNIYCTKGSELYFRIAISVGSDDTKEIYFGVWSTRKMRPSYDLNVREYLVIKKKDLGNWELYGSTNT